MARDASSTSGRKPAVTSVDAAAFFRRRRGVENHSMARGALAQTGSQPQGWRRRWSRSSAPALRAPLCAGGAPYHLGRDPRPPQQRQGNRASLECAPITSSSIAPANARLLDVHMLSTQRAELHDSLLLCYWSTTPSPYSHRCTRVTRERSGDCRRVVMIVNVADEASRPHCRGYQTRVVCVPGTGSPTR